AGLALWSLVFLIMGLIDSVGYMSLNWLADDPSVPKTISGVIIGISMIYHGISKNPLPFCGTVLYGLGGMRSSF
ncbi:MAG: hypothetical protein K2G83_01555, partial [Ruminococcus sp.]|nr:hypothetical protein [Ruminococcus sp.]